MTFVDKSLPIFVGILSILGVVFSVGFLMTGGANPGFEEYPFITRLHVLPGLLYLAAAPLQFLAFIRTNNRSYHRWAGRVLVMLGIMLGSAALFLGIIIPYSGIPEQVITGGFGLFFLVSIVNGFKCARAREFDEHREWMIRAFSIGLSIVTMRLIFIPILVLIGEPTVEEAQLYSIVSFTISFFLHAAVGEWWIRHTRTRTNIGNLEVSTA